MGGPSIQPMPPAQAYAAVVWAGLWHSHHPIRLDPFGGAAASPPFPGSGPTPPRPMPPSSWVRSAGYLPFPWASWIDVARDHAPPPAPFGQRPGPAAPGHRGPAHRDAAARRPAAPLRRHRSLLEPRHHWPLASPGPAHPSLPALPGALRHPSRPRGWGAAAAAPLALQLPGRLPSRALSHPRAPVDPGPAATLRCPARSTAGMALRAGGVSRAGARPGR